VELITKKSFLRDWDNIGGKGLNNAIEDLAKRISKADSVSQIPRMKRLRNGTHLFKIEIRVQSKIYWIVCDMPGNKVRFVRIKSETWRKKNL
jgi:hypothetical protein